MYKETTMRRFVKTVLAVLVLLAVQPGCSNETPVPATPETTTSTSIIGSGGGGSGGEGTVGSNGSSGAGGVETTSIKTGGDDPSVTPAEERRFGIEVDQPEGFDHGIEIEKAKATGSSVIPLTLAWVVLEPTKGERDLSTLSFAMDYYRDRDLTVLLSIPTINTVAKLLPTNLKNLPINNTKVLARFANLLDDVLAISELELTHLVIGNEVNVYLGDKSQAEWDAFETFVSAGTSHVNETRPEIEVGISVTFGGLAEPRLAALTASTDAHFITYYYIGNDFGGVPADNVEADLATMATFADGKPLILKEFGYPTGEATGGSEQGQADFIRESFTAWDKHAKTLTMVMFSLMFDHVYEDCEKTAAYYGFPDDEAFIQFLCTLGLRTVDDKAKPAWDELAAQASARGF
ncbi:hypothetical protein JYT22_01005 [Endomicrobium sp. AH-315-J14]|nr:hypothetical protein [Endomicrobium sp. AH-315-J14]